jgi:hypothetical protein
MTTDLHQTLYRMFINDNITIIFLTQSSYDTSSYLSGIYNGPKTHIFPNETVENYIFPSHPINLIDCLNRKYNSIIY